jgi:methylmalonyl-CoA mutase cobalamin-binding domain/chain
MLQDVKTAVETGKIKLIKGIVQEALDAGVAPEDILNAMVETMGVVGDKFQRNEVFVPEMLVAAMTMKKGVAVLRPLLAGDSIGSLGKLVIGTVQGDLHDIGKNLVALMMESAGFEVIDLGVDVAPEKFVEALKENPDCKVLGLSSLLTTTMGNMKTVIDAVTEAGLRGQVKIMVGGAPISAEFAEEIGADAYTADAGSAARKAKELVSVA